MNRRDAIRSEVFFLITLESLELTGSLGVDLHLNALAFDGFTTMTGAFPSGRIYVSTNGCVWTYLSPFPQTDDVPCISAFGPGSFVAGTSSVPGGVWRTTNSGLNWTLLLSPGDKEFDGMTTLSDGIVIAATGSNPNGGITVWRTTNIGAVTPTWGSVLSLPSCQWLRVFTEVNTDVVMGFAYTGNSGALCVRSNDRGGTWTQPGPITTSTSDVYAALTSAHGFVLVGTHPTGKLLRSTSAGAGTFTEQAETGSVVRGLTRWCGAILAWCDDGTVWRTDDEGVTWVCWASWGLPQDGSSHIHAPIVFDGYVLAVAKWGGTARIVRIELPQNA